jgi:hypothetical protein
MRIRVQTAFLVVAVILSTPVAGAELSPNLAEWPTGDVWPSEAAPQRGASTADQRPRPATPPQDERQSHAGAVQIRYSYRIQIQHHPYDPAQ